MPGSRQDSHPVKGPAPYGAVMTALARAAPGQVALVADDGREQRDYTRAELESWSNGLAAVYSAQGLRKGDFATVALGNGAEFVAACLAVWKLGAVPNPVSHRLPEAERAAIIDTVNPRLVIGVPEHAYPGRACVPPDCAWEQSPAPEAITPPHERAMTSGGSTGTPKVIVASNPAVYDPANATSFFRARDAVLVPGPLYHGAPFSSAFGGLLGGCKVVVMHRFDAAHCMHLIQEHQVDRMMMVPTMLQRIWRLPAQQRDAADISSLQYILVGGAPCPAWLMRAWIDWLGPDVMHEAFGSSERSGGTFITGREWLQRPGSVGRASPGCRLKILGPQGEELGPGEMGEIFVAPDKGIGSTYTYIGDQPRTTGDGWETFGDMGYLDEDGYLYLGDRRTDMIVSGGRNIYPAEVEAAIDSHPDVRSSAVIGLPDADLGQRVHAIVDTAGSELAQQRLREYLADRLVHYKLPSTLEFVDTPLRDDAGKVRRFALRQDRLLQ